MRALIFLFICLLVTTSLFSQKIKYKDLYPRISGGDPTAFRDLKSFIGDSKNSDHPNANYQMAVTLEAEVDEADILRDTTLIYQKADSAIRFYRAALSYIDEKELKKNDEYYQEFYRRDLRTGEFGIKISDVHLTIEKRIEHLQNLTTNVRDVNRHLTASNNSYDRAFERFQEITTGFDNENQFLITAKAEQLDTLGMIQQQMEHFQSSFDEMKVALSKIENPGFGPELKWKEIGDFSAVTAGADFYNDQFDLYQFDQWASSAADQIEHKIIPLRNQIIEYDARLDKINQNLTSATSDDLKITLDDEIASTLKTYDEDPVVVDILQLKVWEIGIRAMTDTVVNPGLLDSTMVDWQVVLHDSLVNKIRVFGEGAKALNAKDVSGDIAVYQDYFDQRFDGKNGYLVWIDQKEDQYNQWLYTWINSKYFWAEKSKWGILDEDTIPLFIRPDTLQLDSLGRFVSLNLAKDDSLNLYPIGLEFEDGSPKAFVASFANSRELRWFESLDLEGVNVGDSIITVKSFFAPSDSSKLTFYFYDPNTTDSNNFAIYNVDLNGELVWSNVMQLAQPESIKYNAEVLETIIYLPPDEGSESLNYVVIDRTGKVRK